MIAMLQCAGSGLNAQQMRVDMAADNLANVSTTAFKSSRPSFGDLLYRALQYDAVPRSEGARNGLVGAGCGVHEARRDFRQGGLMPTGRGLDVAIEGPGFFAVQGDDGQVLLTRDGRFRIDSEMRLVTSAGHPLEGEITLPDGTQDCCIAADGTVTVTNSEGDSEEIGRIKVYNVLNPGALESRGNNLYAANELSGEPQELDRAVLRSGYLERSNTDIAAEMTTLIETHRAYQVNIRMVRTTDELWELAHRIKE
ncbi:MAG: flagellar hook-basal body protein [Peptococcaceae bacterium]|nr:flagellar hook-basal body protein [Peptococcaceae bacterium]